MSKKILLVDDEERLLRALARRLRTTHPTWEVFEAISGAAALELLQKTPIDLVISDLQMPVMDGAAFLHIVRKKYPAMIRFCLSGHAQKDIMLRAKALSDQYFAKPCDTEALANIMEEYLKKREPGTQLFQVGN